MTSTHDPFDTDPSGRVDVFCSGCRELVAEDAVTILNIEEDMEGRDRLTFQCPECGTISTSLRLGR